MKIKIIIVGDTGTGKTCLLNRYIDNIFYPILTPTIGADVKYVTYKDHEISLWDTAGQERFGSIITSYFRDSTGALICFSLDNRSSFESIDRWMSILKEHCQPDLKVILVGTKSDIPSVVSDEEIIATCGKKNLHFFKSSSKKDSNIKDIFEYLFNACLSDGGVKDDAHDVVKISSGKNVIINRCC